MTLTDRIIDSLSAHHDRLVELVAGLDDTALQAPSAAVEWRICDVLSHLGSGAEIMLTPFSKAAGADVAAVQNQEVWDRWNAASPRAQAEGFVEHNARLIELLRGLSADERQSLRVDLDFLPEPVPLEVAAGMRLNEVALHTWDIDAGMDPTATIDGDAAELLLELSSGPIGFLLGFIGKPDALDEPAVVDLAGYGLSVQDSVSLVAERPAAPTATFTGAPEAAARLLSGRLRPEYTPAGVVVEGNVTLDDLRRVFPGF